MTQIRKSRVIRPSSRQETSDNYKIDTKKVTKDDELVVTISHETKSFLKNYWFDGIDLANRNSIHFKVKETTDYILIEWQGKVKPKRIS